MLYFQCDSLRARQAAAFAREIDGVAAGLLSGSYVTTYVTMPNLNITTQLGLHARQRSAHPAIEDGNQRYSYAELEQRVALLLLQLRRHGVQAGDCVGLHLADGAGKLALMLALARLQVCVVLLNRQASAPDIRASLASFQACALLTDNAEITVNMPVLSPTALMQAPKQPLLRHGPGEVVADSGMGAPLFALQSSGTSGAPKRFILGHVQLLQRFAANQREVGIGADDRYLAVINSGFFVGMRRCLMMLHLGGTVVIQRGCSGADFYRVVAEQSISYTSITPAHLRGILQHTPAQEPAAPQLKLGVSTAAITPELRALTHQRLTPQLFEIYGTNEVCTIACATPADHATHADSVGRVAPGIEVQVVDAQDRQLPQGEVGMIRCRGPFYPTAYWRDAAATAQHFRDGWFYPGDLVAINARGYVFYQGRADDVINNEGAKFYPVETEEVLLQYPAVAEAAVIPWPHPAYGQVAVAFVVAASELDEKALQQHCTEHLPGYKRPALIMVVRSLPRNAMGKVVKRDLAQLLQQQLAKQQQ